MLLFLNVIYVLIAIAMVALILMQRGAGAQAGSGFGAGASATVFGARGSANFLSKSTKWLAILFFAISLFMAWQATHNARPRHRRRRPGPRRDVEGPAAPAPARPATRGSDGPGGPAGACRQRRRLRPQQRSGATPTRRPRPSAGRNAAAGDGRATAGGRGHDFRPGTDAGYVDAVGRFACSGGVAQETKFICPDGGIGRRTTLRW